jgi:predicted ATP-dependent protease
VQKAIQEGIKRHNLAQTKLQEYINKGIINIKVEGEEVGQVNGLSVYEMGAFAFGRPNRITASTSIGKSGIVNIEREVGLSGRIHDKGVLILSGFLRERYAQDFPLSLSASICFEQSYSGVEGDSASSTEVYALLSSLSNTPIKQSIAVTGSVDQKGNVQPVGGINYKIEGFFDICRQKGLTGHQGVIIPAKNVDDLMLKKEVIDAVKENRFHIWAVETIDEGMEILTGVGRDVINKKVRQRLQDMARTLARFERGFD